MYSYIADRSLNSVYKFFFSLTQPSFVISRYPVLWQRFFKAGTVEVSATGPDQSRLPNGEWRISYQLTWKK